MSEDTLVLNFLAGCHSTLSCVQPNEIRSVFLVSNLIDDDDIVFNNVDENEKVILEQIGGETNRFRLPTMNADDLLGTSSLYKLVVHTAQTDEMYAYYIADDVELTQS